MRKKHKKGEKDNHLIKQYEKSIKNNQNIFFDFDQFEKIIEYYIDREEFQLAHQACTYALQFYPSSIELLALKGKAYFDEGKLEQALEALQYANNLHPNDDFVTDLLCATWLELGEYEEIISFLEEKLKFSAPANKPLLYLRAAQAHVYLNQFKESVDLFLKSIELDPDFEEAYEELLLLLELNELLPTYINFFQNIVDNNPYSALAWYYLGLAHSKLKQYESAIQAYEYTLLIDENFYEAALSIGDIHMQLQQYEQALISYKKCLQANNTSPEIHYCIGLTYEKQKEFRMAIKSYQKTLKLDHYYDEAWFGIGYSLMQQNKYYEAIHFLNKALKLNPENASYWYTIAQVEFKVGNIISCLNAFEEASIREPENAEIWLGWSLVYYEQKEYTKAANIILDALDALPENVDLYYRLTAYLISAGKYKKAFLYLENALMLNFEKHHELLTFFPKFETQRALLKIINQFRKK